MSIKNLTKLKWALVACCLTTAAANVSALTIGDSSELGFVNYGIPASDLDVANYVNYLKGMAVGTTVNNILGQDSFTRSANVFSPLDTAVLASRKVYGTVDSSTVSIDLGLGGFEYLLTKYDGPNYGSEVWYIGGMTGTITIPSHAGQYGISGTSLFTPGSVPPPSVPDGGSTVMLLGSALAGLGAITRRFKK